MEDLGAFRDSPLNAASFRLLFIAIAVACVSLVTGDVSSQAPPGVAASPALTMLSKDGRRQLSLAMVNDQEFIALDDLAATFQLSLREDALGAMTVTYKGKT